MREILNLEATIQHGIARNKFINYFSLTIVNNRKSSMEIEKLQINWTTTKSESRILPETIALIQQYAAMVWNFFLFFKSVQILNGKDYPVNI